MKASAKNTAASVATEVSTEVVATTATTKKGIPAGALKEYQAALLEKVKANEIQFVDSVEGMMVAIKGDIHYSLKLTKTPLDHKLTKAGEMVRVRLTTEKVVDGKVVAKKAECNGKEIWAHLKPETQFPRGSQPKSLKKERVLKPKAIKPDHSNEGWI